ncbi:MAG: hypothetical protein IJ191_04585 [Treponema sp.]|nr:hypothetical protein [Treponema sp.]
MTQKRQWRQILALFLFFVSSAGAQTVLVPLDFYGIISPDADGSMVTMTQDLYYTQLSDLTGGQVSDLRNSAFAAEYSAGKAPAVPGRNTAFYAVITKGSPAGAWQCVLHLVTPATGQDISYQTEFDSYYKILTDAKQTIQAAFTYFTQPAASADVATEKPAPATPAVHAVSTETIAGTWGGEEYIDKVVILRGGRGFIIYKNGATMEIAVVISKHTNSVTITQSGKSNASYFPELPRATALALAPVADPLSWTFSLTDSDTLSGTKHTFQADANGMTPVPLSKTVVWTRR